MEEGSYVMIESLIDKEKKIDWNNEREIDCKGGRWLKGAINVGDLE